MDLADIKRWQWIIVGIVAGLALGFVWAGVDSEGRGRMVSQADFERELTRQDPKTKQPLLTKIVVHPPSIDFQNHKVQQVTFLRTMQGIKDKQSYRTWATFVAKLPYQPQVNAPAMPAGSDPAKATVVDYLSAVGKQNAAVHFNYGWWEHKPAAMLLAAVASVLLVGGIWPTLLNVMVGAGLGGARVKRKKEDYFDRFSHAPEAARTKAAVGMSEKERARLDAMNVILEKDLAKDAIGIGHADTAAPKTPAEVRKLEGGPLETVPAMKKTEEEDEIEVKGEYYPVLIHHHKKHEDEKDKKGK